MGNLNCTRYDARSPYVVELTMATQKFPDSQREPFGPKQLAWIDEKYGKAFFRDAKPLVQPCVCKLP